MRLSHSVAVVLSALAPVTFVGCAGDGASGQGRISLPTALGARWSPPEFATRPVDGERVAVLDACVAVANELGYSVSRYDGAAGRVSAARRQGGAFDGARERTLDVTVSSLAPGAVTVALVLRDVEESADADGRGAMPATSVILRDRPPYDLFFERLAAALTPVAL